jgi:hypothetical protein
MLLDLVVCLNVIAIMEIQVLVITNQLGQIVLKVIVLLIAVVAEVVVEVIASEDLIRGMAVLVTKFNKMIVDQHKMEVL